MREDWLADGIVYQVMPDRFAIGGGRSVRDKHDRYPAGASLAAWDTLPVTGPRANECFFGGDLDGIRERLDYLADLGATVLWLTPIFPSPSNHKYDAVDMTAVDPAFGDLAAFDRLVDALHKRGLRLMLDLALDHVSDKHPAFAAAVDDPSSKYRDWFHFDGESRRYTRWFGYEHMPMLNLGNPDVRRAFLTGKKSPIRFWLSRGVDGIRLDCANDLGLDTCLELAADTHARFPDARLIGEVSNYAPAWARALDGVQSYFLVSNHRSLVAGAIDARQFGLNLQKQYDDFGRRRACASFSMLSSHDRPRLFTLLGGDLDALKLALLLQFTLPGAPLVYYGEENGMEGGDDPANRAPMAWDRRAWKAPVRDWYRTLVDLRRARGELRRGRFTDLSAWLDNGVVAYLRHTDVPAEYSVTLCNFTKERKTFRLFLPHDHTYSQMDLVDVLGGTRAQVLGSSVDLALAPGAGAVYVPDGLTKPGYDFFLRNRRAPRRRPARDH